MLNEYLNKNFGANLVFNHYLEELPNNSSELNPFEIRHQLNKNSIKGLSNHFDSSNNEGLDT